MKITEIEARCREALTALSRIIVGKDEVLQQMLPEFSRMDIS